MLSGRIFLLLFIVYSVSIYSNESKKIKRYCADYRFKGAFDIVLDSDCSDISKDIESICRCIYTKNKYTFNTIVRHTDCNPDEWFRETLLECAIRVKKNGFIKPLIILGANATKLETWMSNAVMIRTTTPLHYAIYCKNFSAALDLVTHHNADTSIKDYQGRNALFVLCNTRHEKSKESLQLLEELLKKDILDPKYVDIGGLTCMDKAAQNLNYYIIPQLINHGAVPDATGQISTLCHAGDRFQYGEAEYEESIAPTIIRLLRSGANPYMIDKMYEESFFKQLQRGVFCNNDLCKQAYYTWRFNLKLSHRMFKQNACAGTLQWNRSESKERKEWEYLPSLPLEVVEHIFDYAVPWSKQICNELRKKRTIKRFIKQEITKSRNDDDTDSTRIQAMVLSDQERLPSDEVIRCNSVEVWVEKHVRQALS